MDKIVMKLKSRPVEVDGKEVSELELGDADIGGLEGIQLTLGKNGVTIDAGLMPRLIAAMAQIPPSSARRIALSDLVASLEEILAFLGLSQETGETS